jgi:hypothetical protein
MGRTLCPASYLLALLYNKYSVFVNIKRYYKNKEIATFKGLNIAWSRVTNPLKSQPYLKIAFLSFYIS